MIHVKAEEDETDGEFEAAEAVAFRNQRARAQRIVSDGEGGISDDDAEDDDELTMGAEVSMPGVNWCESEMTDLPALGQSQRSLWHTTRPSFFQRKLRVCGVATTSEEQEAQTRCLRQS